MGAAPNRKPRTIAADAVTTGVLVFGVYLVAIALFGAIAPNAFWDELGRFGPRNDHYIHDVSAFQGGTGLLLLVAVRRPSWRAPALAVTAFQFGLHTLSHAVDLSDAEPRGVGVMELAALAAATLVLVWLFVRATRAVAD